MCEFVRMSHLSGGFLMGESATTIEAGMGLLNALY